MNVSNVMNASQLSGINFGAATSTNQIRRKKKRLTVGPGLNSKSNPFSHKASSNPFARTNTLNFTTQASTSGRNLTQPTKSSKSNKPNKPRRTDNWAIRSKLFKKRAFHIPEMYTSGTSKFIKFIIENSGTLVKAMHRYNKGGTVLVLVRDGDNLKVSK